MSNTENTPRKEEGPVRWELVRRVREEIAVGVYETPEKMDLALARLLERLDEDPGV
jgi:hypothetical protein